MNNLKVMMSSITMVTALTFTGFATATESGSGGLRDLRFQPNFKEKN
jgi:hypothetical protein